MSVALLFTKDAYANGISNLVTLFQSQYPSSMLQIVEYTVDLTAESVNTALDDYFAKYPEGNRSTLSEFTSILLFIEKYLETYSIPQVLCLTVSTTTSVIQRFENALSYAPPLRLQVMTQMLVIRDYGIQNVHILFQTQSQNPVFLQEYRNAMLTQCSLLGIPSRVTNLSEEVNSYEFTPHSAIVILADTEVLPRYFTPEVLTSVPFSSYLALTNLNYDVGDIFHPATAFVFVIAPLDYTSTSQLVQTSVQDKFLFYGVYGSYDSLLTLNVLVENGKSFNVEEYTRVNVNTVLAYSNGGSFDAILHAIPFGNYDIVFTKNVLLSSPRNLDIFLDTTLRGVGVSSLRDSYSVFRTAGIIPFFSNEYYYVLQNLSKVYSGKKKDNLVAVKFEKNFAAFFQPESGQEVIINVSEAIPNRFYSAVDPQTSFFLILERIFECGECPPRVNSTMSKKTLLLYIPS